MIKPSIKLPINKAQLTRQGTKTTAQRRKGRIQIMQIQASQILVPKTARQHVKLKKKYFRGFFRVL